MPKVTENPAKPVAKAPKPQAAKPPKKPAAFRPNDKVIYPVLFTAGLFGDDALTLEKAKILLGWEELPAGAEGQFKDWHGKQIRCRNNTHNRPFNRTTALRYGQDVLNRNWADSRNGGTVKLTLGVDHGDLKAGSEVELPEMTVNGETIIISRTGQVDSGQRRLIGFVMACQRWLEQPGLWYKWKEQPTLECIIQYGTSDSERVVRTLDNVDPRTLTDVLMTSDEFASAKPDERQHLCRMLTFAVDLLWDRTRQDKNTRTEYETHSEAIEFIGRHPRLLKAVKHVHEERDGSKILPPGNASAVLYLMGQSASDPAAYLDRDGVASEKKLDWDNWQPALDFWTLLASRDPADHDEPEDKQRPHPYMRGLRNCRRPVDGDVKGKGYGGHVFATVGGSGALAEKLYCLTQAWDAFKGKPANAGGDWFAAHMRAQDLEPRYIVTYGAKNEKGQDVLSASELKPHCLAATFGGIDTAQEVEEEATEETVSNGELAHIEAEAAKIKEEKAKAIKDAAEAAKAKPQSAFDKAAEDAAKANGHAKEKAKPKGRQSKQ